jgi:predicted  nucleic acid-binding Zn-ribbon protein
MPYVDCPRCHASFRVGSIYEPRDTCPRCGAPFFSSHPRRLRVGLKRRAAAELPDWEAITGSQYLHNRGRAGGGPGGDAPASG